MTTLKPDQKVALVTGAGRNIGRAIAHALSKQGFALAINVRASVSEGQAVVDELLALGTPAILCVADVTDRHSVQGMMDSIESNWGRLDVVVNNAAIRREAPLEQVSVEDWRNTLAVVLDGAFYCSQAALPLLRLSPMGAVINIGGLTAHTGAKNRPHVVTAKSGLVGLTRGMVVGLRRRSATVALG
jgi:3-oxoacyl-[acyl-carrier protein] reductase